MSSATADRPEVWVNCAASIDGRIAFAGGVRARLSGPEDLRRVHRLRASCDGIVVGAGTVRLDDPSLTVDPERAGGAPARPPTRIVLVGGTPIPATARIFDTAAPTLLVLPEEGGRVPPHVGRLLVARGPHRVERLWGALAGRGFRRILVEGGARVLASVLRSGTYDTLTVFTAPWILGAEGAPPIAEMPAARSFPEAIPLSRTEVRPIDDGVLTTYRPVGGTGGPPEG
ncbi:MAG: dihydrofolate reductase family protein [Thermoplasmata archaeon]